MNSIFDIRRNCVKLKADINGKGLLFRGSGVLYPLGDSTEYDYVLTAQHILKDGNQPLALNVDKIASVEIELFEEGRFISYQTVNKEEIAGALLPVGEDFLIIKIAKNEIPFTSFWLADDLIVEKPMRLYGISKDAQELITSLECKCVDGKADVVTITSSVDNMDGLHGMSGGGLFAVNQPLMYGVLWKFAAIDGEFHNVRISQALEEQINEQITARGWEPLRFINIAASKRAMFEVYNDVFHDINDTILVNRDNAKFPLEARFVMPDFLDKIQGLTSYETKHPELQPAEMDTTNIYQKYDEIQEYSERYLKEFYSQLNRTSDREVRIPASSILTPNRDLLLIVGGPGYGKSSLLKYLTLQMLEGKIAAYEGYLPIWMPFSYMARNCDEDVKSIIRSWLEENKQWERNSHYIEYAFVQKKVLLIADGIDEWGDEPLQADRIIRKVKAETDAGNLLAIFSSREYGIENINSPFSAGDTYAIAPLSALQQDELVKKCVDHYNGLIKDTKRTAEFLSSKLRLLQDVDRMKENPMLLTILIGQYLQGNELPHNNIAAMDCIVEQLFVKHPGARKYQAFDYSKSFDYTSNKMLLGVLSKEMFDNYYDGNMDKAQAEILLNQYLNSQTKGKELDNAWLVDKLLQHDKQQLGILEERSGTRISFINRQLQEYMAAKYLSIDYCRAKSFVEKNAPDVGLHQVILFLFEMMPASAFVDLYQVLKQTATNDYRNYYLRKLKLEILVRSVKAPKQFLLDELEEYLHVIEWDSDYDIKHDLLEILLEGLYNSSLTERVERFISKYIPSASVYHDIRLSGLMQVAELTEDEKHFIVHTLINGDVSNKILASDVIRKHIADDGHLLEAVNAYITPATMPEVVAFFIRSIIIDGIETDKEDALIKNVPEGDIYTRFYKIEFALFRGEAVSVDDFLKLVSELPYTVREDASRLLEKYYAQNETVRKMALDSVAAKYRERGNMERNVAWRYLLSCWLNHPDVINSIAEELKETYPFNYGNSYELWEIIQRQELSPTLLHVITQWAIGRDKKNVMWGIDSLIVNSIVNDPRIKAKLLEALDGMTSFQHIVVHPLLKNWGKDADVIEQLQRCLEENPLEQSTWIAGYTYEIYQGDDKRIKAYLDRCINDASGSIMKDRAVSVYITHYKEEFAEKYIQRILNGEIAMSDRILGSKWGILEAIIENYHERQDVKDYLLQHHSDDFRFAGQILVKYHGTEMASDMLRRWYHLDTRLRLMMIHKMTHLSNMDERVERILRLFRQEGNAYVLCDMVLCLADHLKRKGRDAEVIKLKEEVFNTNQLTTEYIYKMRFCIYLMYHKLDEYVELALSTGGKEYEFNQFNLLYNDSPYIEKTLVDEVEYLLADDMAYLRKIVKDEKKLYLYMVFFSKYVNPTSNEARILVNYFEDNKDRIDDANILLFLKRVGGQKALLKELVIANIDNTNNEMSATLAQIIASDFDKDEDIRRLLLLDEWDYRKDSINRVSLNCSLNTNDNRLKAIFAEYKEVNYELSYCYASFNFLFSLSTIDKVVENLKYYLTNLRDSFVYRLIRTPLISRLKRDKEMVDRMYEELMQTEDPRVRVAFYSILLASGVRSAELRDWRKHQHEYLAEYGYDIVQNRERRLMSVV